MSGTPQKYHTTMSWQQLIAAVTADMTALYAQGGGTVTSVGLTAGSADIVLGGTNPVMTSGNISVDLSAGVKTALSEAGTALQPVTGLGGSYTYASLTLNASGQITAVASGSAPVNSANPSGTVGLSAVNGSATTYMRSDAAPPLSQAISPTWTGQHLFTYAGIPVAAKGSGNTSISVAGGGTTAGTTSLDLLHTGTDGYLYLRSNGNLYFGTDNATFLSVAPAGTAVFTKGVGFNGAPAPTQVTGWGTPTGGAVVANFNGASGTLVNCSNAIAELITILKAAGIIGA